ncbi:MAG: hypothetical protein ACKVZJ_16000 [Phycisphaerales bacterium]
MILLLVFVGAGLAAVPRALGGWGPEPVINLTVNATDLPRNLIKTVQVVNVKGRPAGPLELRYCIWTPGNHNPSGPIENVVNLVIKDCDGNTLHWDRDPTQVDRVTVAVPEKCEKIDVYADYIASQPSVNSRSSDSYGRRNFGAINFNTLLVYPAFVNTQELTVGVLMFIPKGWKTAWALPHKTQDVKDGTAVALLARPAMPELIDSPIIMGEFVSTADLKVPEGVRPHTFHVAASEEKHAEVPALLVEQMENLVRETVDLFGKYPRQVYRFLVLADEGLGFGLEHAESTFVGVDADEISSVKKDDLRGGGGKLLVLPHEYFHVWCGKLRAPEGLITGDFTAPARTELLWVYEGLTAYYDMVLGARSGMITPEEFQQEILDLCVVMQQRSGRMWRSVEDTARAARFLRQRGISWFEMRRGQDYYSEAALFWLEADALIRQGTGGAKSLDDFCRAFFDVPAKPVGAVATYSRADVVAGLEAVYDAPDWDALIRDRLERPVKQLDLTWLLEKVGFALLYAQEPTALQKAIAKDEENVNLRTSLGLVVAKDGTVTTIIPGSPADKAGMHFTSKIVAVNGWVFTPARLKDAVKDSVERKSVELMAAFDDRIETFALPYEDGPRVPRLIPIPDAEDLLAKIGAPRVKR